LNKNLSDTRGKKKKKKNSEEFCRRRKKNLEEEEESELLGMSWGSSKFGRSRMHGLGRSF
jgi:hypothetical protein